MGLRVLRVWTGLLLITSGGLMYAASAERWGDACGRDQGASDGCSTRQDHLYDFLPVTDPWVQVGDSAVLAGWSILVLAVALPPLAWAMAGRRPGVFTAIALAAATIATAAAGLSTLRSGLTDEVVETAYPALTFAVWFLVPPFLFGRLAVAARGWARAAAIVLIPGTPMVAAFTYAIGPYDANPWWEGISGAFTALGGACLVVAAWRRPPEDRQPSPDQLASSALA